MSSAATATKGLVWRASTTASGNLTEADAPSTDAVGGQPGTFTIRSDAGQFYLALNGEDMFSLYVIPGSKADQIYFLKRYAEIML